MNRIDSTGPWCPVRVGPVRVTNSLETRELSDIIVKVYVASSIYRIFTLIFRKLRYVICVASVFPTEYFVHLNANICGIRFAGFLHL